MTSRFIRDGRVKVSVRLLLRELWGREQMSLEEIAARLQTTVHGLRWLRARLKAEGHPLPARRHGVVHDPDRVRRAARTLSVPPRIVRGGVPSRVTRVAADGLVTVGVALGGRMTGSPAVRIARMLRGVLRAPPVPDVLIYDAEGRLIRRLDGLTRQEKPLLLDATPRRPPAGSVG